MPICKMILIFWNRNYGSRLVSSRLQAMFKKLQIKKKIKNAHDLLEVLGGSTGPYFPVFGLNTRKYGPEKTPYLGTFHVVKSSQSLLSGQENLNICSEFLCESASQAKKKFPFTVFSLLHKCSHFKGTVLFTRCWSLNFAAFLTCESDNDHPKGTEQSTPRLQAQLLHPLIQLL